MREIKFRAWDDGRMVCQTGALVDLRRFFRVTREDSILMQFTGLTDKNGKEIYEGDVLKRSEGVIKVVFYNQNSAAFYVKFNQGGGFVDPLTYFTERDCEVIGNIYEHEYLPNQGEADERSVATQAK